MEIYNQIFERQLLNWLRLILCLVFLMVVVGGLTRLTGSGLSIVDWNLIMGIFPPFTEQDWLTAFTRYQQFPEFQQVNGAMTLGEFKGIFYWEYFHRLLGRSIGVVFFLPFAYWLARGQLAPKFAFRLFLGFVLGGAQGALGWFMVKSGLVDVPRVSHLRLAAHLVLALFILSYFYWIYLEIRLRASQVSAGAEPFARRLSWLGLILVVSQITYGAFTAGLRAGKVYNTYPKMGENWLPPEVGQLQPIWQDLIFNVVTVQFIHRILAATLLAFSVYLFFSVRQRLKANVQRRTVDFFLLAVALQFVLGICTLIYAVPVALGSIHQAVAILVLLAALKIVFTFRAEPGASYR